MYSSLFLEQELTRAAITVIMIVNHMVLIARDGSRTAATSKMVRFVIKVNSWKPLTIITKCSNLDVAAALDLPLIAVYTGRKKPLFFEKLDPSLNSKIK